MQSAVRIGHGKQGKEASVQPTSRRGRPAKFGRPARLVAVTLPQDVIDLPELGTLNIHASLLPALRGAAPIQAAIRNGLAETGVTIMRMVPKLDAGPVLLRQATPIFDDETAGVLLMDDPIRTESSRVVRALRAAGVRHVARLTGDDASVAAAVSSALGLDAVHSQQSPGDKLATIRAHTEATDGLTVMIGDGVNDAPALAGADLGVAMGARGATASSEAADVVLTIDRLDRVVEGMRIAHWSRRIALQSVVTGMGLSFVAMGFAAVGLLPPVAGAVVQEVIDVTVILNALRALRVPPSVRAAPADRRASAKFRGEHDTLLTGVDEIKAVADHLDDLPAGAARAELDGVLAFLAQRLLPHERTEERELYPRLAAALQGEDPTGPLISAPNPKPSCGFGSTEA